MSLHYFDTFGNYGSAAEGHLVIVDSGGWTEEEWREVENATDGHRMFIAAAIAERKAAR